MELDNQSVRLKLNSYTGSVSGRYSSILLDHFLEYTPTRSSVDQAKFGTAIGALVKTCLRTHHGTGSPLFRSYGVYVGIDKVLAPRVLSFGAGLLKVALLQRHCIDAPLVKFLYEMGPQGF